MNFCFPGAHKSYVYAVLHSMIKGTKSLGQKKGHSLIIDALLLKMLVSPQLSGSHNH